MVCTCELVILVVVLDGVGVGEGVEELEEVEVVAGFSVGVFDREGVGEDDVGREDGTETDGSEVGRVSETLGGIRRLVRGSKLGGVACFLAITSRSARLRQA